MRKIHSANFFANQGNLIPCHQTDEREADLISYNICTFMSSLIEQHIFKTADHHQAM